MGSRGPRPKDPQQRARRNTVEQPRTVLRFESASQPDLPDPPPIRRRQPDGTTGLESTTWCQTTLAWWATWGASPQAEHFSSTDWQFLADTAVLHNEFWKDGNVRVAPELRQRERELAATMASRATMRVQFAEADEKDGARSSLADAGARARYGYRYLTHDGASQYGALTVVTAPMTTTARSGEEAGA